MLYSNQNVIKHFNQAASSYDQVANIQQRHIALAVEELSKHIRADSLVADIGCGTGGLARQTSIRQPGWNIIGVDMASKMCARASEHQHHTVVGDMQQLALASDMSDATCCNFTLQWSNDPSAAIAELARITKPGGAVAPVSYTHLTLPTKRIV